MPTTPSTWRLDAPATTLVFDLGRGFAELAYLGPSLPAGDDGQALCQVLQRGSHESEPETRIPRSILPLADTGYFGTPVVDVARAGRRIALSAERVRVDAGLHFHLKAPGAGVSIESHWAARSSGVFEVRQRVSAEAAEPLQLISMSALVLPLPSWAARVEHYSGRWSAEMQATRTSLAQTVRLGGVTHGGRSGFSGGQWFVFDAADTSEHHGFCLAVHLAWSGDHVWHLETDPDGRAVLSVGARLRAGEIHLERGGAYAAPPVVLAFSESGRAGLRNRLHRYVREDVLPSAFADLPRKVHLNTWEACGFDLSLPKLMTLAEHAAALGVERFVLDDGWFSGRRNDRSSLGDWQPSKDLFPQGLDPLIRHVESLGMDFGLWIEPEMVSPESALYRQHPQWCLSVEGVPTATQRHQLVLDLTRPDVIEYLFTTIDDVLRRHAIAALKWDHNRELFPMPVGSVAQTESLYRLLDRLRKAHPSVEIETCASGGGRVDYALLSRCTRFWASDNNDPIERLRINRSWLQFLPLRACGHHVGPSPNPITGRALPMDFRAKVAMFGHLGVEADPQQMSEADRQALAAHIALYKAWRAVLHHGEVYELEAFAEGLGGWFVLEKGRGLALATQSSFAPHFEATPVRLAGLDPAQRYRVRLLPPWPELAARYLADASTWQEGVMISGAALMHSGISLPLRHPATAWLIAVEAV